MIEIPNISEVDKTYVIGPARLRIERDDSPMNPWEDCDGVPPLATFSDRNVVAYHKYGDPLDPFNGASEEWINEKWPELCKTLEINQSEKDEQIQEDLKRYSTTLAQCRREEIDEALGYLDPSGWSAAEKYFDTLAELWELRGIKALSTQVNGYCQGHSTLLLLVATPEYLEVAGVGPEDVEHDLKFNANLYGAWAFGDVYGYIIKGEDDEDLESCWGFFGIPWGNNPRKDNEWDVVESALDALKDMAPYHAGKALEKAKDARRQFLSLRRELRTLPSEPTSIRSLVTSTCRGAVDDYYEQKRRAEGWCEIEAALREEEPVELDR